MNPTTTLADLETLGLPVPAAIIRAAAISAAISADLGNVYSSFGSGVGDDFLDRLADLTPAAAAQGFERAAMLEAAHAHRRTLWNGVTKRLDKAADDAILEAGDSLIEASRPAFDAATATLAPIALALGPGEPDPTRVLEAGPKASRAWHARTEAVAAVDRATAILDLLGQAGYVVTAPAVYLASIEDADDYTRAEAAHGAEGLGVHNLLAAGYKLRLNTAAESGAILTRVADERRQAEAEAARQAQAAKPPPDRFELRLRERQDAQAQAKAEALAIYRGSS